MTLDISADELTYLIECVDDRITAVRCGVEPHPPAAKKIILNDLVALQERLNDTYKSIRR